MSEFFLSSIPAVTVVPLKRSFSSLGGLVVAFSTAATLMALVVVFSLFVLPLPTISPIFILVLVLFMFFVLLLLRMAVVTRAIILGGLDCGGWLFIAFLLDSSRFLLFLITVHFLINNF